MPDACFSEPRLAAIYDALEGDRGDLDLYLAIASEVGARSVLDVGCGTGALACSLVARGLDVTGLDPARASIDVARGKPSADRVRWIIGEADAFDGPPVDLVTMTGNVAQVFVSDAAWTANLRACRAALRRGGWIAFEARDPERRAWGDWTPERTATQVTLPDGGTVRASCEVTDVALPTVSFRWTFVFAADGAVLRSDSTLRFRGRDELTEMLHLAGFTKSDVRDAPDRPGAELVFLAQAV